MKWLKALYERTISVAKMYTGTFIVVMILNQLIFFGFCLNPVCLIAAMPHVLLITVFIGSWLNKENYWGDKSSADEAKSTLTKDNIVTPKPMQSSINSTSKDSNNQLKQNMICPKCNAPMIMRTAQQGKYKGNPFWGCSKYPQCKSIVNIFSRDY